MANICKQIYPNIFSWKVTDLPISYSYLASEYCFYKQRRWDLRLYNQQGCLRLYFKSNNDFNHPIKIFTDIPCINFDNEVCITEKNQQIIEFSLYPTKNLPFEIRIIFKENISRAKKTEATSASMASEKKISCYARDSIHFQGLSRDFLKLLVERNFSDVTITCDGKTFQAHRIILQVRSEVFSAMLKTEMVEGKTGLIAINDIKFEIFECFLRYIYTGILPELNMDLAKELYKVGDQYAVAELKLECSDFMIKNLSAGSAFEMLLLADLHSDQEFRKKIIAYIIEKEIPKHDKNWSDFCKCHYILANEILNLYIQKI